MNYKVKMVYKQNPGKDLWYKVKKSSKNGKDQKSFNISFSVMFCCYDQNVISEREAGHFLEGRLDTFVSI